MILLTLLLADGTPFQGKCPVCIENGETSTVTQEGSWATTAAYCGEGFYDEAGQFHHPEPCNTSSASFKCSNGHVFGVSEKVR